MDLRERLELTRHVRGCALLDESGAVLGSLGAEASAAVSAGRALAVCFAATGMRHASLAGGLEGGGQIVAQTDCGRLLVVRTDGSVLLSDAALDVLREALSPSPAETRIAFESGVRRSDVYLRDGLALIEDELEDAAIANERARARR